MSEAELDLTTLQTPFNSFFLCLMFLTPLSLRFGSADIQNECCRFWTHIGHIVSLLCLWDIHPLLFWPYFSNLCAWGLMSVIICSDIDRTWAHNPADTSQIVYHSGIFLDGISKSKDTLEEQVGVTLKKIWRYMYIYHVGSSGPDFKLRMRSK